MRRISLFVFALLTLLSLSMTAGAEGEGGGNGPYLALDPPIVVNLVSPGSPHFMQVKVQVMSHDPKVLEAIKDNMPPVRDALIMLLSAQTATAMYDVQNREKVRQQALDAIRKVLEQVAGIKSDGQHGVEALYFTDFIIQ